MVKFKLSFTSAEDTCSSISVFRCQICVASMMFCYLFPIASPCVAPSEIQVRVSNVLSLSGYI
jgi:hypothetical protein